MCLPSVTKLGVGLPDGSRLKYRMNGLLVYAVILSLLCALVSDWDFVDRLGLSKSMLGYAYDHYVELLSASVASTLLFSVILYLASHRSRSVLCAQGGNTGSRIYDFFIGRELNPRLGRFDLKEFCELYPGLIGWVVIDLAMAYKQYELHGAVSNSMAMVCLFHAIYVADALYFEKSILTTMDIVHDGFGFMLAFGDLAWVPFTYSLQARYLVDHPIQLSNSFAALVLVMKTVGYLAFRGANGQKDRFRRDPNSPQVKHVKYIKTQRGTKLMISGWWGIARHINYTADWLMGLSWCLCCGFDHVVPYFHAVLVVLHGALRGLLPEPRGKAKKRLESKVRTSPDPVPPARRWRRPSAQRPSAQLQDEAQPAQGEVDQGVQGGPGQGPDERHDVRAGEEAEQAGEVQPRHHAEDPEGHGEDHGDPKPARVQVHREPLEGEEEAGEAAGEEAARPGDPPNQVPGRDRDRGLHLEGEAQDSDREGQGKGEDAGVRRTARDALVSVVICSLRRGNRVGLRPTAIKLRCSRTSCRRRRPRMSAPQRRRWPRHFGSSGAWTCFEPPASPARSKLCAQSSRLPLCLRPRAPSKWLAHA